MLAPVTLDPLFKVRCESRAGAVVVIASGEIDLATSPQLRAELLKPEAQAPTVVLDLRQVTFIDSSGLGVIVGQQKRSQEEERSFSIAVDGVSSVRRILDLSGLAKILDVVADPAERL
jgi:anti-sigma B factor antagonist